MSTSAEVALSVLAAPFIVAGAFMLYCYYIDFTTPRSDDQHDEDDDDSGGGGYYE